MNQIMIDGQKYDIDAVTYPNQDKKFREAWAAPDAEGVIAVDWAKYRTLWRARASMTRVEFIMAAVAAGVLSASDAPTAAKGDWPSSFDDALAAIDEADRLQVQITWAGLTTVPRSSPFLSAIAATKGLTENDLDALFGYDGD